MTFTVGLTGGIASGKSTVADLFAAHGVEIIDTDLIAREVVEPGTPALREIAEHFGAEILNPNGSLNRKKLRALIFVNPKERIWLEQLLHPLIRQRVQQRISQARSPYCIVVIPLLTENKQSYSVQRILVVDAPEELQLKRLQQRDQSTPEQARAILATQATREQRLEIADDVIVNDQEPAHLTQQVADLHRRYLQLASGY